MAEKEPEKKPAQKQPVINIDEGDNNADWIKRVRGGKSQRQELAIHAELALKAKGKKAKPTNESDNSKG